MNLSDTPPNREGSMIFQVMILKKKNIKNTRKNLTTCLEQHWIYPSEQNMSLQDQF